MAQASNYSVKALAKACGVSARHLRRFFLQRTGKTPRQWLRDWRQMRAIALLAGPRLIKQVADQLGFKQPSHFSRQFKHYHGLPPRETRSSPPPMSDSDTKCPF